tara:strand:- start:59 stop:568 length:510 start_codon:yes stop_codon:yes gene_type:complete
MKLDISNIDLNNEQDFKELHKYTMWYNFFSNWIFIWFLLFKIEIIKIQPPILFYYFAILFMFTLNLYSYKNDYNNNIVINSYSIVALQIIIAFIFDILPLFYLSYNNLFNIKEISLLLIYSIIYLIYLKVKFKNKNILNTIFKIYLTLIKINNYKNITIRKYIKLYIKF